MPPVLDDAPEVALAILFGFLAAVGIWLFADRRSTAATRLSRGWPGAGVALPLGLILFGAAIFAVVAEDVVSREPAELVLTLDRQARIGARALVGEPGVRVAATAVSWLTGEGLALAVAAAAAWLWWAARRRDAVVLLAGTLSAWLLTGALKLAFGIRRPAAGATAYAITAYGFPSGHAVVTTVAVGLIAWLLGRRASTGTRALLALAAAGIAVVTAASRVVVNAHWLSDVAGGLGVGAAWLGLVLLAAARGESPA